MKIKNKELVAFMTSTIALKKLPLELSYAIAVNIGAMSHIAEAYDKKRDELKKEEDSEEKINELLKVEVEANVTTVPASIIEELNDPKYDVITPLEFNAIGFMLEKEEKSKKKKKEN